MLFLPALALAEAMNSGTVLVEDDGLTTMTKGARSTLATVVMSRMKLKLSLL